MISNIPIKLINGSATSLETYKGKVVLIVNVASKCGLTPQYEGLEVLFEKYKEKGFVVLGFPANNFGAQEPGTNEEIQSFCSLKYAVTFPMFEKISVKGTDQHPLYKAMIAVRSSTTSPDGNNFEEKLKSYGISRENPSDVLWNFEKFLVNKKGEVVERFSPDTEPMNAMLLKAIEAQL